MPSIEHLARSGSRLYFAPRIGPLHTCSAADCRDLEALEADPSDPSVRIVAASEADAFFFSGQRGMTLRRAASRGAVLTQVAVLPLSLAASGTEAYTRPMESSTDARPELAPRVHQGRSRPTLPRC